METPGITLRQVFWLIVCSRFIFTLVLIPYFQELQQLRNIIVGLTIIIPMYLLSAFFFTALWKKFPELTLIECLNVVLGSWIGRLVGMLYLFYFLVQASITLRIFNDFLAAQFFNNTPALVIGLGILLVIAYCIYMGLEVLGRCAQVLGPLIFAGVLILVLLSLPQAHWLNVLPSKDIDVPDLFLAALPGLTRWSEWAWLAMIVPYIGNKEKLRKTAYGGILFVTAFWFILLVPIVAIFSPDMVPDLSFPTLQMVQIISIGDFLERLDALVLGLWVFGAFLKIGILYYVGVLGSAQWFGLKRYKSLILPAGLILLFVSVLLFSNEVEVKSFGKYMVPVDFFFIFIVPAALLAVYFGKGLLSSRLKSQ